MKFPKIAISALLLTVAGCSSVPSKIERSPEIGTPAIASIGDPIYRFSAVDRLTIDYLNGDSHGGQGQTKELLYSGVSNGQLRLTYREFEAQASGQSNTANFARPAFSQDVQYDYSGGTTEINFQSVQIEVQSADSRQISYKVMNGFREEQAIEAAALCSDKKWTEENAQC